LGALYAGRAGRGKTTDVKLYLDWNRYEYRNVDTGADIRKESLELSSALESAGYRFAGGEVLDSYDWGGWRARTDEILATFFPLR